MFLSNILQKSGGLTVQARFRSFLLHGGFVWMNFATCWRLWCHHLCTVVKKPEVSLFAIWCVLWLGLLFTKPLHTSPTAPSPASLAELLSSIFSSAAPYSECGSAAFRCCLAYLVQASDRQANRANWMDAASSARRADPNSSLQISAQPFLICHRHTNTNTLSPSLSHTQKQNAQSLVFKLLAPMFFTMFSYPVLHLLLFSLSLSQWLWVCDLHTLRCMCSDTKHAVGLWRSAAEVEFIISFTV